jgi:hypothetical protein
VLFFKKSNLPKVTKHEFFNFVERIKSHFLDIKDTQLNTLQKLDDIHTSHNRLTVHVGNNFHVISKWIDHFNEQHKNHKKEMIELKNHIYYLNKKLDENTKRDERYIKSVVENYINIPQKDKSTLKNELIENLRAEKDHKMAVINVNNDNNVNNDISITRYNVNNASSQLTKSEAKIMGHLFNANNPMSYNDLSLSTGHSPNTIKVYINSLKKKGVKFDEIDTPNGSKMYAIPNKEKVKKLYNF